MMNMLFSAKGRVNRQRFWLVGLGVPVVFGVILGVIFAAAGAMSSKDSGEGAGIGIMAALAIAILLMSWIGIVNSVKRYHDVNKSGWWILISLVPVIGAPWYLIECGFFPGTPGPNNFGADPLAKG